jgi:hypothetical protein
VLQEFAVFPKCPSSKQRCLCFTNNQAGNKGTAIMKQRYTLFLHCAGTPSVSQYHTHATKVFLCLPNHCSKPDESVWTL